MTRARAKIRTKSGARIAAERRGRMAETLCALWLQLTGWRILARRLRAKAGYGLGEIDIIAKRSGVVAFIEVKARTSHDLGREALSHSQRRRIARAAAAFAARTEACADCELRFDVMIVDRRFMPLRIADAWRLDNV